jgi:uncharacterized protein YidB (DUF937 family)
MGLMDLAGSLLGGGQDQQGGLMGMVTGLIQQQGGLQGLLGRLNESGLGEQAASWVGRGENLPIGADQIRALLGNEALQSLASKAGLGHEEAASGLAALLPQVVDKLTPNGQVPQGEPDLLGTLKGLLG